MKRISSAPVGLSILLCIAFLTGCGSDKPLVPTSGIATYGGGNWPMPGTITLTPLNVPAGMPSRPGSARFGVDGKFVIGSYKPGDGLMPGSYHVVISCYDPLDTSKPAKELEFVPADFKPDNLVVEVGQDDIVLNYDVPKKQ